jgi:uncharacterized metal-binding protein YceD (DUF177 family)
MNAVEFSRPVAVDRLSVRGTRLDIAAEPAERQALAKRLGVEEVRSLTAHVLLKPLGAGPLVRVSGSFTAEVVQTCVVTLVPVAAGVTDEFDLTFGPDEAVLADTAEIELSLEDQDPPDPIVDGLIDVGEAVVEHLSLALDPFPRAPGAVYEAPPELTDVPEKRPNPFAVLAPLRQKKE